MNRQRMILIEYLLKQFKNSLNEKQSQKILVTKKGGGKSYEVTKSWWQKNKSQYDIVKPNTQKKTTNVNTQPKQQPKKKQQQPQKKKGSSQVTTKKIQGKVTSDDLDKRVKAVMKDIVLPKKSLAQLSPLDKQKISAKIDELAKLGKQAQQKGQKAPNYNLCQITIPGTNLYCQGNKGIPRAQMPQFKGAPRPGSPADKLPKDKSGQVDTEQFFKDLLKKKGIKVSQPIAVPPDRLKATQSQLVGVKVAGMSKVLDDPNHPAYSKITAPIYVSKDGYVLDGHHRWAAIVAHNAANPKAQIPMNVRVIDQGIVPLVKASNQFAEKIGIKAKAADTGKSGG